MTNRVTNHDNNKSTTKGESRLSVYKGSIGIKKTLSFHFSSPGWEHDFPIVFSIGYKIVLLLTCYLPYLNSVKKALHKSMMRLIPTIYSHYLDEKV